MEAAQILMQRLFQTDIFQDLPFLLDQDLQGWNSYHPCFARLIAQDRPNVVIDVGVWKGASTIHMASLMKKAEIPGVVIAVDTFLGSVEHLLNPDHQKLLRRRHGMPQLYWQFLSNVVHAGMTERIVPLPQTSETAAILLSSIGAKADLIHIDAAHDYEAVLRDARSFWKILQPGGIFIGDDYHPEVWPGVVKAANEFATEVGLSLDVEQGKWMVRKPI